VRRVLLIILFVPLVAALAACSYGSDFVVVNGSEQPAEVRYRVTASRHPVEGRTLAKTTTARLRSREQGWQELTAAQYELGRDGSVTVRLMPGESLRVAAINDYEFGDDESRQAELFPIMELAVSGAEGELRLSGAQARKAFARESAQLYTLTYR
jgi:hypothetical protein